MKINSNQNKMFLSNRLIFQSSGPEMMRANETQDVAKYAPPTQEEAEERLSGVMDGMLKELSKLAEEGKCKVEGTAEPKDKKKIRVGFIMDGKKLCDVFLDISDETSKFTIFKAEAGKDRLIGMFEDFMDAVTVTRGLLGIDEKNTKEDFKKVAKADM